jgi:hypothetical protein
MAFPILEALPAIHATLIGIVGALYSVFVMYGYQKIQEANDVFRELIAWVEKYTSPSHYIGFDNPSLIDKNGGLSWEGIRKTLKKAKSIFPMYEGRSIGETIESQDDEVVVEACHEFINMLYVVSVSYPFSGKPIVQSAENLSIDVRNKKEDAFTEERLLSVRRIVVELMIFWGRHSDSVLELASRCEEVEGRKELDALSRMHEPMLQKIAAMGYADKAAELRVQHVRPREKFGYSRIIVDFFERIKGFETEVVPKLDASLRVLRLYSGRFKIRERSKIMLFVGGAILFFGVIVPLLLLHANSAWQQPWNRNLDVALLVLTMAPYFIAMKWLWGLLDSSDFS